MKIFLAAILVAPTLLAQTFTSTTTGGESSATGLYTLSQLAPVAKDIELLPSQSLEIRKRRGARLCQFARR